jgi:hypothetical protein
MAFQPGFVEAIEMNQIERIETDSDGNEETIKPKIGKDVVIGGQEPWKLCEMSRKSDIGWEAAMVTPDCPGRFFACQLPHTFCVQGSFYLTENNQYGLPCSTHFWAVKFLKCDRSPPKPPRSKTIDISAPSRPSTDATASFITCSAFPASTL